MAVKKPLCNYAGTLKELQEGDTLAAANSYVLAFNATTDWGSSTGGYYSLAFTHNLNSTALNVTLWDTTGAHPVQVFPEVLEATSVNVVTIKVPSGPDKRFAGVIVIAGPSYIVATSPILVAPGGSTWSITIDNDGNLSAHPLS